MRQKLPMYLLVIALTAILTACNPQPEQTSTANNRVAAEDPVHPFNEDGVPLGRLPRDVLPVHYRIELVIIPEKTSFEGHVEIDLDFTRELDNFYIHGEKLRVSASSLLLPDGSTIAVEYEEYLDTGIAHISLSRAVSGPATLVIDYDADFNESLEALYRVKSGGDYYAFTQFEAISARLAFPGFDEPSFKVSFDQALIVEQAHVAIAGTPVVETQLLDNGLMRVRFATTKPLPTYLLVYAVGPLEIVTAPDLPATQVRDHPLPLRGIAARGKGEQLAYALENTEGILTSLENYFGIPYPYAKLDIIAVPDFAAGAMENAGAITYREQLLLFDESASIKDKRSYQRVHAHELAHQWFGDLVTPYWWNDIWLNEAFATWMAYVALENWRPDEGFRRALNSRMLSVMTDDSRITARKILQPIHSNHDIATAFDGITYSKGGGVINMIENLLGREAFRRGVHNYMLEHSHGNASSADFISAISAMSADIPAAQVESSFYSFLEQPGLPLVETMLSCQDPVPSVTLRQSRYLPVGSAGSANSRWEIPVCLRYAVDGASQRTCLLLTESEQQFELPVSQCPDYLMPNADGAGYYRWSMSDSDWNRLLTAMLSLSTEESMSLAESLNGAFNSGQIDVAAYYNVASQLSNHESWQVATASMDELAFIYNKLADSDQQLDLQERFAGMYAGQLDRVGLAAPANNDHAELQEKVVNFMADLARLDSLREELKEMAWAYTGFPGSPGFYPERANANLIGIALRIGIELDDEEASFASHLLDLTLTSSDATIRQNMLKALGYAASPEMAERVLELVLSQQIRGNEITHLLDTQMGQGITQDAAWLWLQENLDAVVERLPTWRKGKVVNAGEYFCDADKRQAFESFFTPKLEGLQGAPREFAKNLEIIDLCIAKKEFHQAGFNRYMESR